MHNSQAKSDVLHEMRQKTSHIAHCRCLPVKKNYVLKRLYRVLLLELLYYVNNAMAVYLSFCSGITIPCPDPGAHGRGDGWVHFVAEGKSFLRAVQELPLQSDGCVHPRKLGKRMCRNGGWGNSVLFALYVQSCGLHDDRFILLLERSKWWKRVTRCVEEINSLKKVSREIL